MSVIYKYRLTGLFILCFLAGIYALNVNGVTKPKKDDSELMRDYRKADYFFMEGSRQQQLGNSDSYFELLSRAHTLNPEDKFVGKEYGYALMRISEDSVSVANGYELMKEYVRDNPDDFYANVMFATLSSRLGHHDEAVNTWRRLHETEPGRPEIIVRYADALTASAKEENMLKAIALYDTLESREGPDLQLTSDKIRLYLMQGDTAAIFRNVKGLLNSAPSVVEYNVFAGDVYSHLGVPDSAIAYYDRAIELDPGSGLAHYSRAMYYQSIGDSAAYDREVFHALEQESLDVEPKIEILRGYTAKFYTDSLQQPRISAMFNRLIELHPHEVDIHTLYRDYLVAIHDYEGAAEQASYALDIDPSDENQWLALASLYLQNSNMEGAYEAAERGIHFFNANPTLRLIGATALSQLKRYGQALDMLNEALSFTPQDDPEALSDIYTTIGDVFYGKLETDSAFIYYSRAIELNPENMTALNNCAYYLACEDKDLDKALKMIQKVNEERPDEATSLDTYAWVLFKRKEYEAAREMIEEAIIKSPEPSAELYDHAGDIYFMNREPKDAVEMWKKALELDPENDLLQRKVRFKTYFYE